MNVEELQFILRLEVVTFLLFFLHLEMVTPFSGIEYAC